MARRARPSPEELAAAAGRAVPDVIAPGLALLFCGINPGLWSGAVGHHFAHPGNRFWKALRAAGYTADVLAPEEEQRLLDAGVGVTNLVARATRGASEVGRDELRRGAGELEEKVRHFRPRAVAVLGLGAYRHGFERPGATVGRQPELLAGALLWVVPNPSGIQAHYPFGRVVAELRAVREATGAATAGETPAGGPSSW